MVHRRSYAIFLVVNRRVRNFRLNCQYLLVESNCEYQGVVLDVIPCKVSSKRSPMSTFNSKLRPADVVNIGDLRRLAQKRLPRVVFEYIDRGAEDEVTMRQNLTSFDELKFRARNAVCVSEPELRTTVLGMELAMPVLLAPCGLSRLFHPHGEVGAARAAGKAGVGYVLSTMSGHRLEDVAQAASKDLWYQLYLVGGKATAEASLDRARRAGFTVLVVTIDTPTAGMRERDVRNGMGPLLRGSTFEKIPYLRQFLSRPAWLFRFLLDGAPLEFPNIVTPGGGPLRVTDTSTALAHSVVTWDDLRWLRHVWSGPIVAKGVLTSGEAKRAVEGGCAAVIVSNHGGRQLDGVSASLRALPEVLEAVGDGAEVMMDGGVRRGSHILKALCLGARAVLVGRAYAYGLGAAGETGASWALSLL